MKRRSMAEIKKFQEKLRTDEKFAKEWEQKQQVLMEKVKNELFTDSFIKKIRK